MASCSNETKKQHSSQKVFWIVDAIDRLFKEVSHSGWNVLILAYHCNFLPQSLITLFKKLSLKDKIQFLSQKSADNTYSTFSIINQVHDTLSKLMTGYELSLAQTFEQGREQEKELTPH